MRRKLLICILILICSACSNSEVAPSSPFLEKVSEADFIQTREALPSQEPVDFSEADVEIGPIITPTFFPAVYTDTSLQLETFDTFWNIVHEEYVFRDFNGVDWEGIRPEYRAKVENGMNNPEFWKLLEEMLLLLDDEHSYLVGSDKSEGIKRMINEGVGYSGVGVFLSGRPEQNDVLASWVIPGNGLHNAGIRTGDRLIAVDGNPLCCYQDQPNSLFAFFLGPEGSQISVTYQRAGQPIETVLVTRGQIKLNDVILGERLTEEVAYLQINTFEGGDLTSRFREIWNEINSPTPAGGVIIDLRRNSGGRLDPTYQILSYFIEKGPIFYEYDASIDLAIEDPPSFNSGRGRELHHSQTMDIVILVGEGTASAAERFAGVLRDRDRGITIGRPTAGNIEAIYPFDLPDGSFMELATESIIPLSGENWEENGVPIDILVEQALGEIERDGVDLALEKALEILSD